MKIYSMINLINLLHAINISTFFVKLEINRLLKNKIYIPLVSEGVASMIHLFR